MNAIFIVPSGITLVMDGSVQLQLSAKSIGLFEAFYNSIKPVQLVYYSVTIAESGDLYQFISFSLYIFFD